MPKQVATLNDFSGGLNDSTDKRDLDPNEFEECTNLDPHKRGKLITSSKFKPNVIDDNGSVIAGYGMFAFSNDYEIDNTADYKGYFIAQADGSGNVDIYQSEDDLGWKANKITSIPTDTPAFLSAEGDLFISGNTSTVPSAFIRVDRVDFNLSSGSASTLGRTIGFWGQRTQAKPPPTTATQQIYWENDGGTLDVTADCGAAADELIWAIEWHDTAGSGTWFNTGDYSTGPHVTFASSWLYKNGAESDLYSFTPKDYVGDNLPGTGDKDAEDLSLKVYAMIESANITGGTAADVLFRSGARLYAKQDDESEYYLLAEVSYENGIIGDSETDYSEWSNTVLGGAIGCSTGFIENPPSIYSYYANNGFSTSDIPDSDRKVQWKCGVVANSRAYIGNVTMNGRSYGDRIFKSPAFQYDVFTENQWIESTSNDGDQITAMSTYADRILMFKKQSVVIINVSQIDEFVEIEKKEAGVEWPAAVAQTQFGIAWANETGCFLYTGDNISNLLYTQTQGGQTQKIDDVNWSANITSSPVVGFDPKNRQLIVIWNASSATNAYIYSFDSQSWSKTDDILTGSVSNMINVRGGYLYIQGGTEINKLTTRTDASSNPTVTLQTGELSFGNYESKKNLNKVIITYQGGSSQSMNVYGATEGGGYGSSLGTMSGAAGRRVSSINLMGDSDFQGKKTFQFKLSGTAASAFELEDISFVFRDLGVH